MTRSGFLWFIETISHCTVMFRQQSDKTRPIVHEKNRMKARWFYILPEFIIIGRKFFVGFHLCLEEKFNHRFNARFFWKTLLNVISRFGILPNDFKHFPEVFYVLSMKFVNEYQFWYLLTIRDRFEVFKWKLFKFWFEIILNLH